MTDEAYALFTKAIKAETQHQQAELKASRELCAKHAEDAQRLSSRVQALEREVAELKRRQAAVTDQ